MWLRKKAVEVEAESSDRWLVSYADFITLLFAFFTVLFATSQRDAEKSKVLEKSIQKDLMKAGPTGGETEEQGAAGATEAAPISAPIKKYPKENKETVDQQKIETVLEQNLSEEQLKAVVKDIEAEENGVRISLSAKKLFEGQTSVLTKSAPGVFNRIAKAFAQKKFKIYIESHTSDRTPSAEFKSSWDLAAARANVLTRYLIQVIKIDPKLVAAVSYGDSRPLAPNSSEENRNANERIDILISNDEQSF